MAAMETMRLRWVSACIAGLALTLFACGDDGGPAQTSSSGGNGTGTGNSGTGALGGYGGGDGEGGNCGCEPCYPIQVTVSDIGTDQPLDDAVVTGPEGECEQVDFGEYACVASSGMFTVTVAAPGYEEATYDVTVEPAPPSTECCGECPPTVSVDAALTPMAAPG